MVRFDAYKIQIPYNAGKKKPLGKLPKSFFVLDLFAFTNAAHVTGSGNEKLDSFD